MKEKFSKPINVKTIVTLALTSVFAYLSITRAIASDQFLTVFTVVVSFYFGTQHEKAGEKNDSH